VVDAFSEEVVTLVEKSPAASVVAVVVVTPLMAMLTVLPLGGLTGELVNFPLSVTLAVP